MLDKQPKVWYNGYRKKRGEQNVQVYQWCSCSVCGAVCVRNDYGKYVKKGQVHTMDKKKELGAYKKMSPEEVQGMLHLRKRGYTAKNKKAYNRKKKHKGRED